MRLYSEQNDNTPWSFQAKQAGYQKSKTHLAKDFPSLEFIKYSTEEITAIFKGGLGNLPEMIPESLKGLFPEEIIKNIFNQERRYELSLNEETTISQQKKSERGYSIDEGH
jgi:hypothetical protein